MSVFTQSLNPTGNRQIWLNCAPPSPYSPDLAPSDFHLFGSLKVTLRGTLFEDDENVIRAVRTWLREQETSWYREGMHDLVSRWRKAVDLNGDYV
jgi:histone-lysine N-methyltransferase SETMAR